MRFSDRPELWAFRIREYEGVIIEDRVERMRDADSLLQRLAFLHEILWLHPSAPRLRRAGKALVPRAVRSRVRAAAQGVRIVAGR
jgi:hypothetical protein